MVDFSQNLACNGKTLLMNRVYMISYQMKVASSVDCEPLNSTYVIILKNASVLMIFFCLFINVFVLCISV